jgi:hypothetical protein
MWWKFVVHDGNVGATRVEDRIFKSPTLFHFRAIQRQNSYTNQHISNIAEY